MKHIYLSGPMTNMPDLNFPLFHTTAPSLQAAGHTVTNPAELNPDPGMRVTNAHDLVSKVTV